MRTPRRSCRPANSIPLSNGEARAQAKEERSERQALLRHTEVLVEPDRAKALCPMRTSSARSVTQKGHRKAQCQELDKVMAERRAKGLTPPRGGWQPGGKGLGGKGGFGGKGLGSKGGFGGKGFGGGVNAFGQEFSYLDVAPAAAPTGAPSAAWSNLVGSASGGRAECLESSCCHAVGLRRRLENAHAQGPERARAGGRDPD